MIKGEIAMCISKEQEAALHELKRQMGIDDLVARQITDLRYSSASLQEAQTIIKESLNPVVRKIIEEFCPGRKS